MTSSSSSSSSSSTASEIDLTGKLTPSQIRMFPNLAFQLNQLKSKPDGDYVTKIQQEWRKKYNLLEYHHGYIQWLFPLFEAGMNHLSVPLSKHEAELLSQSEIAKDNMMKSFDMMLNFWGFVYDPTHNVVSRHPDEAFMTKRFNNWMGTHNDLRVTRCMKSLNIVGLTDPAVAFLRALHYECSDKGYPQATRLRHALVKFWIPIFEENADYKDEMERMAKEAEKWNPPRPRGSFFF